MNASRLRTILETVASDIEAQTLPARVAALTAALSASLSEPTPARALAFEKARDELVASARACEAESLAPSFLSILEATGLSSLVGEGLARRVMDVLGAAAVSPARVVSSLQSLKADLDDAQGKLQAIADGLESLGVETADLGPEEYEVGVSIPMTFLKGELTAFQKELAGLDKHMRVFAEIAGDAAGSPRLRCVSSSDPSVFLMSPVATALIIATAIERIVALYKSSLEIRLLREQLKEKGVSKAALAPVLKEEEQRIGSQITELAQTLLASKGVTGDKARRNELLGLLERALRWMADRLDRGWSFEVTPPVPVEQAEGGGATEEHLAERQKLEASRQELIRMGLAAAGLVRAPDPILMLAPGEADEQEEGVEAPAEERKHRAGGKGKD